MNYVGIDIGSTASKVAVIGEKEFFFVLPTGWSSKETCQTIEEKLKEKGMSQKEFSQKTGIAESSISDWKKKHTNPVSDKILIICEVLDISPYELLSGAEHIGTRSRDNQTYVFAKDTELGMVVETYQQLDYEQQKRLLGYMDALKMNN